ncbi:EAL domain-containing protein [Enterobacter kobei]|uniref:EAL domain-containing protein n=2 Tax=Enterobacter cloacae complex TaxID=354276 RepID=UPI001FD3E9F1|nr:cyclic diguanylate phosphodiesterase [Enterobacter kobei]
MFSLVPVNARKSYGFPSRYIFMTRTPTYHRLLLPAFFLLVMGLGTALCYLQMQNAVDKEIHLRLKQATASLDVTLGHAKQAATRARGYLGESCSEEVLTSIRTIVATIPDIRTVSMVRHNEIYCTSVFGGKTFSLNQADYPDDSLILMGGNQITPSKSLLVYTLQDGRGNSVLIGIDGYYLYNVLRVLDGDSHLYLQVGERYLDRHGHVSLTPDIRLPVALSSDHFRYTVIADRAGHSGFFTFIHYERNLLIAILVVSLLLSWLFRSYLGYRDTIEFMLRSAIEHKQLKPWIQPIVKGEGGQIVGGEVLVRWEHPKLGFIPPDKFISVAEQSGLIKEVTAICFGEVIQKMKDQEKYLPEGLFICFNTSAVNFENDEIVTLCAQFQSSLESLKARVVLEITERESIEHTLQTRTVTEKLRQLGVQFSLDDFGTGYANYSYLQQFQPEFIKVDKMFTSNVSTNAASALVVKNMVNLARKFNSCIIAEGVEDNTQLQALQEMGIDTFQGYYFYHPLPIEDYIQSLSRPSESR